MKVFRLSKKKYAYQLNGKGASKFGSRWNSKGTEIIYTAESRALAMAEVAVHLTLATLPGDFIMIEIDIPDHLDIETLKMTDMPENWANHPPILSTQTVGDQFVGSLKSCVLKVPSSVVQGDFNYLINPHHQEFSHISIVNVINFPFDKRLFSD